MLPRLLEQVALLATAMALLGVPGAALVSLLRVRRALPDTLAVPAGALLGVVVACVATFVQLTLRAPVEVAVATHVGSSLLLAAAAVALRRRRSARGEATEPVARGWNLATTAMVLVGVVFAWVVRGVIRLDGLYHVSVSRKLVELAEPAFGNVNRFADGGPNPTYALPAWHAFVGWCSWLTGLDPIGSWEIMPVLVVALGALAAAGLARVVLGGDRGRHVEVLGAGAWVLMRILYARREVDGDAILYGAVPGQLVFELVLPVVFGGVAVALTTTSGAVRRAALAAVVPGLALIVVLHANYLPYVAIVGIGYVLWWAAAGGVRRPGELRRTVVVGAVVAACCAAFLGVLLPLLAQLENFGNPSEESRIDYHLAETFGAGHIRGGHLYEMLGLPGLVALLAAPVVALTWRSPRMSVISGGLLAVGATCLVPPLFALLASTGSLTIGLRINHVVGVLLGPVLVAALLLVAERTERGRLAAHTARRRLTFVGTTVALMACGVALGYTRFLPDLPGYVAWAALVAAWLAIAIRTAAHGRRSRADATTAPRGAGGPARRPLPTPSPRAIVAVVTVLVVGLGLPVGAVSMRRAVLKADPFTGSPLQQGDLNCLGGPVAEALVRLPPSSVVLSDPATSFRVMALAPVYVVGDYKVWNSPTKDNRVVERLARVNRFFDTSVRERSRMATLRTQGVDYLLVDVADGRWLEQEARTARDPATEPRSTRRMRAVRRALDGFADLQVYDGAGIARLVARNPERFRLLASDRRGLRAAIPEQRPGVETPCSSYVLWEVRG